MDQGSSGKSSRDVKPCGICGEDFEPYSKRHVYCGPACRQQASNQRVRAYMQTDKGRALKKRSNQKWAQAKRVSELRIRYNVTPEQMLEISDMSTDRCYICLTDEDLCIDHCHETGLVRGLLCRQHNAALGRMGDSLETLELFVEYLKTVRTRNPHGYGIHDESARDVWQAQGGLRSCP